jgi:predicted metal-dependent hydrolase
VKSSYQILPVKIYPNPSFKYWFDGKEIDVRFYGQSICDDVFATLSVFLTYGEDLVIETARHHREFIQDPF